MVVAGARTVFAMSGSLVGPSREVCSIHMAALAQIDGIRPDLSRVAAIVERPAALLTQATTEQQGGLLTEDAVIRECPKCAKWRKFAIEQGMCKICHRGNGSKVESRPESPPKKADKGKKKPAATKTKSTAKKKRRVRFAICSVCHASVLLLEGGVAYEHWQTPRLRCPGSGSAPFNGPPSDTCAVCGGFRPVRQDGRIASHQASGKRCAGSGKSPAHGRATPYMQGLGVSVVVQAGSPGLGKRR
jgi:hypothetical protein